MLFSKPHIPTKNIVDTCQGLNPFLFCFVLKQLLGIQKSDPHLLAGLWCVLTNLPASSPFLPPSCVTSVYKNQQWLHIVYRLKSELCNLMFRPSLCLSSLPPFPMGHPKLMASEILSSSFPSVDGFVLLTIIPLSLFSRPAPIQPSKPQWNVIFYKKPSLILPQQHQLLPSLGFYDTFYTPQLYVVVSVIYVPQLLQAGDLGAPFD